MKQMRSTNSREQLLDAAESVVIEKGISAMTLDAVAARAEVSKGGLLYHFPSKDALVQAMVSRIASLVTQRFATELAGEPPGQGRHARTLIRLMMDSESTFFLQIQRIAAPLLAAMAGNSEMLAPMRQFFVGVQQGMLDDGMDSARSWLVLAVLDGLKFWKIFQIFGPSKTELAKVRLLLERIIDEKPL